MFRRIMLTALLGTGLTAGLTMSPASADAASPIERFHPRFEVVVLRHGCWECYGSYHDRWEADRVANHLRHEGRAVKIRGW